MIKSTEASDRLHAQDAELCLIIVVWKTSKFRQENRYSHYRNDPVKYDLDGGPLSSGTHSRATEAACFDGFLFGLLRRRLSIDCRNFFIFVLVPLGWKGPADCCCTNSMLEVSDLTTTGGKIGCQRHLYHVLCTLDSQNKHVRAFLVYSSRWKGVESKSVFSKRATNLDISVPFGQIKGISANADPH